MSNSWDNLFYNNTSITTGIGATIEYNMNSLIDGIAATTASTDTDYQNGITNGATLNVNPFKKLFPIDSVIKPFRPLYSGVKYFIMLPNENGQVSPYRSVAYPGEGSNANALNANPRVYYPGISTNYKYWVTPKDAAANITITYKQASNPVTGNKYALANKIIARFEKNHSLPATCTFNITYSDNTSPGTAPVISVPDSGEIILYWNGTAWTTTSFTSPTTPKTIKSINIVTSSPASGRVIGVIELSARWIKDISSDLIGFDIQKESSSNTEDILPVGFVTANSVIMDMVKYNQDELKIVEYNRESTSFDANLIYMCKNAEIRPHIKAYHSSATSVPGEYDIIPQGIYFIDSYSIQQYGDTQITAIDGAKYLMETFAPDILAEGYPVTAVIRRLLDSVGFTSYKFNLKTQVIDDEIVIIDKSIPILTYWWTDDTRTVWDHLQELCRDIQMNAVFDDNGILQLSSRDYTYGQSSIDWEFYYDQSGSKLANIISFDKREIPSANEVKVIWKTYLTSNYVGNSGDLWSSQDSYLSAGALLYEISETATVEDLNNPSNNGLQLDTKIVDSYGDQQSLYNFNGYLLIQSEIFEFDALEYQYVDAKDTSSTPTWIKRWIYSAADLSKYRYLSKPGFQDPNLPETIYFKPTGKIHVKSRAALGTSPQKHTVPGPNALSDWTARVVTLQI